MHVRFTEVSDLTCLVEMCEFYEVQKAEKLHDSSFLELLGRRLELLGRKLELMKRRKQAEDIIIKRKALISVDGIFLSYKRDKVQESCGRF